MGRDELITRLGRATEGSVELDFWCWWYGMSTEAGKPNPLPPNEDYVHDKMNGWTSGPSRSVDWALLMVPPGWWAEIHARKDGPSCILWEFPLPCRRMPEEKPYMISARTVPLAIAIAALQARKLPSCVMVGAESNPSSVAEE